MSLNQVSATGELERRAGLVNSEKINEMYEAFPSDASASNKLVAQYTPRSEYSINNSSSNDTWYKVGRYTGGNRSSRLDLISDRVDGQTFESSIRISGAGTNANYVSWIGEDGCENSVNAVQIDSSYNLYIKLMSYSAVRIIAYGNFESFDYEALQSSPSGSNIPLQKLVTESDLTSSVTRGSTAPITSGGVYDALKTTFGLKRVDDNTYTFDLSLLPYADNGLCLINLLGNSNLEGSAVCSIGYHGNKWRISDVNTLVNAGNVGTITASISGTTLTISNTGVSYGGGLSVRVGHLF